MLKMPFIIFFFWSQIAVWALKRMRAFLNLGSGYMTVIQYYMQSLGSFRHIPLGKVLSS